MMPTPTLVLGDDVLARALTTRAVAAPRSSENA